MAAEMDIGVNRDVIISACVAGLAAGTAAIAALIVRLRRMLKEGVECELPVIPRQTFEFCAPGEKYLHLQGPRFSTAFWGVKLALKDEATGEPVPLRGVIFRMVTSGISRARIFTHRCMISHAGRYELTISGIREGTDPASAGVVFTKPYRARAVLFILGLVFAGMLTVASIVFGIMALAHPI